MPLTKCGAIAPRPTPTPYGRRRPGRWLAARHVPLLLVAPVALYITLLVFVSRFPLARCRVQIRRLSFFCPIYRSRRPFLMLQEFLLFSSFFLPRQPASSASARDSSATRCVERPESAVASFDVTDTRDAYAASSTDWATRERECSFIGALSLSGRQYAT